MKYRSDDFDKKLDAHYNKKRSVFNNKIEAEKKLVSAGYAQKNGHRWAHPENGSAWLYQLWETIFPDKENAQKIQNGFLVSWGDFEALGYKNCPLSAHW